MEFCLASLALRIGKLSGTNIYVYAIAAVENNIPREKLYMYPRLALKEGRKIKSEIRGHWA